MVGAATARSLRCVVARFGTSNGGHDNPRRTMAETGGDRARFMARLSDWNCAVTNVDRDREAEQRPTRPSTNPRCNMSVPVAAASTPTPRGEHRRAASGRSPGSAEPASGVAMPPAALPRGGGLVRRDDRRELAVAPARRRGGTGKRPAVRTRAGWPRTTRATAPRGTRCAGPPSIRSRTAVAVTDTGWCSAQGCIQLGICAPARRARTRRRGGEQGERGRLRGLRVADPRPRWRRYDSAYPKNRIRRAGQQRRGRVDPPPDQEADRHHQEHDEDVPDQVGDRPSDQDGAGVPSATVGTVRSARSSDRSPSRSRWRGSRTRRPAGRSRASGSRRRGSAGGRSHRQRRTGTSARRSTGWIVEKTSSCGTRRVAGAGSAI